MSGKELSKVVTVKGKEYTMFFVCQHKGCSLATVAAEKDAAGRKPTGSKKFCKKHAAESRARFKAMLAEQKEAREALRAATIAAFDGRTVKRGGVVLAPARKRSTVENDLRDAGLLSKEGTIRVRKADVPAVLASLAYAGCKSTMVVK